jgi:predicted MFS family arabinose efflux permease
MKKYISAVPRDFLLFICVVACVGFAQSLVDSTLNNFLNDRFALSNIQRTFIEMPREVPGLIVMFVSAALFFMCNRTLAVFAQLLAAAGVFMIGVCSFNYPVMLVWLFVYSMGQHIFLPLASDIGMELAHEGNMGKRLGQLQGAGNFAAIIGSLFVFIGFKYLNLTFTLTFAISGLCYLLGMFLMRSMKKNVPVPFSERFKFKKKYKLYYILSILFGSRKQIFLTFAPWVLVTVFMQKTEMIATLLAVGGAIGIGFKPLLGRAIDRLGERAILAGEAVILIFVCLGYGFAQRYLSPQAALLVVFSCYVADQLLMSVGMARATYLKKIAGDPKEVTSTLTAGVTIDHVFSITVALAGGLIWKAFGYEYIFLLGAFIAAVNLFFALQIDTSGKAGLDSQE